MLTQGRLREVLDYDPGTGIFRWRKPPSHRVRVGDVAGCIGNRGYRLISVDGRLYVAHRLAWFYVYGEWPRGRVDHRDTNKDHNWIDNLRPATGTQNNANVGQRRHNTSGFKGVSFHKQTGKWLAKIQVRRKYIYLGLFTTPEAAHAAYVVAAHEHFTDFARTA